MSSCGLLFVILYSSAAVFMIVDGQTTTPASDGIDFSRILQRALNAVEMQARTIDMLQTQISNFFDSVRSKGNLFFIYNCLSCCIHSSDMV